MQIEPEDTSMGTSFSVKDDNKDMVTEPEEHRQQEEQQEQAYQPQNLTDDHDLDPPSTSTNDEAQSQLKNDDDKNRILRRGDLVRIVARKKAPPKHKHIGALGRIVKQLDFEDGDGGHPFRYDIELVLGGKIHDMERSDLAYTTATVEGMTGESRARRKRKPSALTKDDIEATKATTKKGPKKLATKTKAGTITAKTKAGTTTKTQKKSTTTSAGKGKSANTTSKISKKRPIDGKTTKSAAKKAKTTTASATAEEAQPSSTGYVQMDIYERHRREFERSLVRLEKHDIYQYFLGDVPDEFEENYDPPGTTNESNDDAPNGDVQMSTTQNETTTTKNSNPQHKPTDSLVSVPAVPKKKAGNARNKESDSGSYCFPDHPPYNFVVIRNRMEHGRYTIDLQAKEHEERFQRLAPYYKANNKRLSKKAPRRNSNKSKKPPTDKKGREIIYLDPMDLAQSKAMNWDLFRQDVISMCDAAVERHPDLNSGSRSLGAAARRIKETMEQIYEKTGKRHIIEMSNANDRRRFNNAMESYDNLEPALQGKWRKNAFPQRMYERLKTDVVCAGLSELDGRIAAYELCTNLRDSFLGLAYTYDDTGQSEGWMKSLLNKTEEEKAASALACDDGVIKAQVDATMTSLLIAVQDRVMTDMKVLEQEELRSANWDACRSSDASGQLGKIPSKKGAAMSTTNFPEIVEQEVWGIDCYTRRNISICLETELDADTVLLFIEKWLLPAINACPVDRAHDISNAARILEGLPFDPEASLDADGGTNDDQWRSTLLGKALLNKISSSSPPWLKTAATLLRKARESIGADFFRVHPKGHGSIVLCPKLEANRLVTFYRGEVYPSWRWGEKMDAIEITQQRKGLKPVLPDFFNMALERPQIDPRGYGLMFVDASRKAGHGSMLSHSCQPSCEVRVAAYNGELTLAMTTLREMSIGEELTFDYNAVTESVNEYHSAICLCGYGQCRGSFLHFATADCYQQVLNRNSPIAVRLSNLIKGCMKKVMSEEDERILERHGFHTAAFGAISVNRRKASKQNTANLDSLDIVPVWLRTFVADTLRYIEYERRALPIALICNHMDSGKPSSSTDDPVEESESSESSDSSDEDENTNSKEDNQRIKGSRPEPTFFLFARKQREKFVSIIAERNEAQGQLTGIELKKLIQKEASIHWKALDPEKKKEWRDESIREWEKNGGREKLRLEQARVAARNASSNSDAPKVAQKLTSSKSQSKSETKRAGASKVKAKKKMKNGIKKSNSKSENGADKNADRNEEESNKISFETADGEGIRAMEQRIQQLTQTLSRVGRVLDRHRERILPQLFKSGNFRQTLNSPEALRGLVHSPMSIMSDAHVVAWMWNHDDGIKRVLLRAAQSDVSVSPSLRGSLLDIEWKYKPLEKFGKPWVKDNPGNEELPMTPTEGRKQLTLALLEFRACLLGGIKDVANDIKSKRASARARKKTAQASQAEKLDDSEAEDNEGIVKSIVHDIVEQAVFVVDRTPPDVNSTSTPPSIEASKVSPEEDEPTVDLDLLLENYNKRFKIEKAADLLLMYAHTSTFFRLEPYEPLESSPIEVYARELGNAVPKSAIDDEKQTSTRDGHGHSQSSRPGEDAVSTKKKSKKAGLCEPDDIITEVVVKYQGDYVLSQLLQWFNYGIGQKPGLPDMLGCILLPSMQGCWKEDSRKSRTARTRYHTHTRPRLVEWLKDPIQRGNPWPDELRKEFVDEAEPSVISDASSLWLPFGSPITDFLVTGDDLGLTSILRELGSTDNNASSSTANDLLSTLDHGKPAQAVSNWVQCDKCAKWRRLPWHVDVDTLGDQFYCADNIWNEASASCDAPEDEWDAEIDAQVDGEDSNYEAEGVTEHQIPEKQSSSCAFEPADFCLGARFDVLRTGKEKWAVGVVVKRDFEGDSKRVKFHFPKLHIKFDEWVDISSPRLATMYSKSNPPKDSSKSLAGMPTNGETGAIKQADNECRRPSLATSSSHEPVKQKQNPIESSTFEDRRADNRYSAPFRAEPSHARLSPAASQQVHNEYPDQMNSNSYRDNYRTDSRSEGISMTSEHAANSRRDDYRYDYRGVESDDGLHRQDPTMKRENVRASSRKETFAPSTFDPTRVPRKSHTNRNQSFEPSSYDATNPSYYDQQPERKDPEESDYPSRYADPRPRTASPRKSYDDGNSYSVLRDDNLVSERSNWRDTSEIADNVDNGTHVPWKPRRKFRQELHLSSYYSKKENRERQDPHEGSEIDPRRSHMSAPPSPRPQAEFHESSFRHVDSNTENGRWREQHQTATEYPHSRRAYSPPPSRREDYHETVDIPRRRRDYSPPLPREEHQQETVDIPRRRRDYSPPISRREYHHETTDVPRRRDYSPPPSRGEHHRIELPRSRRDYSPPSLRQDHHRPRRDYSPPPTRTDHHGHDVEISHKRNDSPPLSRVDRYRQDINEAHRRDYSPTSRQDRDYLVPRNRRDNSPPPPRRQTDSFRDNDDRYAKADSDGWRESSDVHQNCLVQPLSPSHARNSSDHRHLEEKGYGSREMERATEVPVGRPSSRSPTKVTTNPRYLDEAPPKETSSPRSLDEEDEDYADGDLELGEVTEDPVGQSDSRPQTTYQNSSYRNSDHFKPEDRARQISRSDSPGHREERHYRSSMDSDHRRDRDHSGFGDDKLRTDSTEFSVRRPHDKSDYHSRRSARTRDDDKSYADSCERYSAQRQLELGRTSQRSTSSRRDTSPRHRSRDEGGSPRDRSEATYDDDERRYRERDSKRYSSHRHLTHERTSPRQTSHRNLGTSPNQRESHYEDTHRSPRSSSRTESDSPYKSRDSSPSKSSRNNESRHWDTHHRSSPSYRADKRFFTSKSREGFPNKSGRTSSLRSSSYDSNGDHNKNNPQQKNSPTGAKEEGLFRGDIAKRFKLAPTVDPSVVTSLKGGNNDSPAARETSS